MTIQNNADKWIFVIIVTLIALVSSVVMSGFFTAHHVDKGIHLPAIIVPLAITPPITLYMAQMMLRIDRLNRKMQYLVAHDQMTGLLNRSAFFEDVKAKTGPKIGAYMMFDIDRFKSINDTFGHHAGDIIIREVAQILKENTEPDGAVARFGGEEFVAYYPDECIAHAALRAEAIRAAVENQTIHISGHQLSCTLSVGLDIFDGTRPLDEVLRSADEALYKAKNSGRNRVVRQDPRKPPVRNHA